MRARRQRARQLRILHDQRSDPAHCRRARCARSRRERDIRPVLAGGLGNLGAAHQFERRLAVLGAGVETGVVERRPARVAHRIGHPQRRLGRGAAASSIRTSILLGGFCARSARAARSRGRSRAACARHRGSRYRRRRPPRRPRQRPRAIRRSAVPRPCRRYRPETPRQSARQICGARWRHRSRPADWRARPSAPRSACRFRAG